MLISRIHFEAASFYPRLTQGHLKFSNRMCREFKIVQECVFVTRVYILYVVLITLLNNLLLLPITIIIIINLLLLMI